MKATPKPCVSVIVCTRNRGDSLARMLERLLNAVHDNEHVLEILLIDNSSSDGTLATLQHFSRIWKKVHCHAEPRKGLSRARNRAVGLAGGSILAWTDDDLFVSRDWIANLIDPILSDEADCVVGRIEIAPHLERDWMEPFHRLWLAENIDPVKPQLIGANMAIRRECFAEGILFDPETGPGALGYMDDTLLGMRLQQLGKKLVYRDNAKVIHHFDEDRLHRRFWLKTASAAGRSTAYVSHHWDHTTVPALPLSELFQRLKLAMLLLKHLLRGAPSSEGMTALEFGMRKNLSYLNELRLLRGVPYKY